MPPAEPAPAAALQARGLRCLRGGRALFTGLGFELDAGALLHVRGANGSGKSSLLRLLCGLLPCERGELRWRRRRVGAGDSAHDAAYRGELAYLGHGCGLSGELTALENLRFALAVAGAPAAPAECREQLARLGLARHERQPARRLSAGQRRRVALARVLLSRRPLWLLDEPEAGLDAAGLALLDEQLGEHLRRGGLAVVATHRAAAPGERALVLDAATA